MRKELEQIIFLGKLTDTIEIFGKVWTLQTMTFAEQADVVRKLNSTDDATNILSMKKQVIKKALISIDDIELNNEDEKEEFIDQLPVAVIDALFGKYDDMSKQLNDSITPTEQEEIKN